MSEPELTEDDYRGIIIVALKLDPYTSDVVINRNIEPNQPKWEIEVHKYHNLSGASKSVFKYNSFKQFYQDQKSKQLKRPQIYSL